MKILKIIVLVLCIPVLTFVAWLGWEIFFPKKYINELATDTDLTQKEKYYLSNLFKFADEESIVFVTTTASSLEDGGVILTNERLISYFSDKDLETADFIEINSIQMLEINKSNSIFGSSYLKVTKPDSTKFTFSVGTTNNADEILFEKIRSMAKIK